MHERITLSGFPLCSYNIDTWKAWLAQNAGGTTLSTVSSALGVVAGIGATVATGGVGAVAGIAMVQGAMGVASSLAPVMATASKPPQSNGNASCNDLFSMSLFNFHCYNMRIGEQFAKIIDGYFTKYGYKTNQLKYPNISARPVYNFTKTVDMSVGGNMPLPCKNEINNIFNSGVTFWKNNEQIGNYAIDNQP